MEVKKPNWDIYYLTIAFAAARRSIDPSTKHGCVIVSADNRVLSLGYNGPIQGANDSSLSMERPQRYWIMIHAEENALLAYSGSQQDISGATAYVTGQPCHKCLRMMIRKGLSRAVFCDTPSTRSVMLNQEEQEACKVVLSCRPSFVLQSVDPAEIILNISEMGLHASGQKR
jgi:dCMP deaminase